MLSQSELGAVQEFDSVATSSWGGSSVWERCVWCGRALCVAWDRGVRGAGALCGRVGVVEWRMGAGRIVGGDAGRSRDGRGGKGHASSESGCESGIPLRSQIAHFDARAPRADGRGVAHVYESVTRRRGASFRRPPTGGPTPTMDAAAVREPVKK